MRLRVLVLAVAAPLLLWALLPVGSNGASLQERIERTREQVQTSKKRERVLASDVAHWSKRIDLLQGDIATLQARQVRLQAELVEHRAELARIQARLRKERLRLARLRARLAEGREALAVRLVEMYKADQPDFVTVILEADGYADLLERTEFMSRVSEQDRRIITFVQENKEEATRTAKRLDGLQERQKALTAAVAERRNQVAALKSRLVVRRDNYEVARSRKRTLLVSTRETRHERQEDLAALEAESARVAAALAAAQQRQQQAASGGGGGGGGGAAPAPAGPVQVSPGGMIVPVNGPLTSPFGPRWGRLHAGQDISAPEGTPIRAAKSGRVVIAGWMGGYGNYTCVDHGGGLSTCYAHQSSMGVSVGQSVKAGQVIGAVGNTGRSFGAHLHFEVRVNGNPVDPAGYI